MSMVFIHTSRMASSVEPDQVSFDQEDKSCTVDGKTIGGLTVYDVTQDKNISYEDLKALLGKSQNLLLIDVRTKEEVDKGQIQGSIHIPVDTVETAFAMQPEEFKAKYGVTKPPLDAPELVFHCQVGRRGAVATDKAHGLGYVNARNYAGGYKEWSAKEAK